MCSTMDRLLPLKREFGLPSLLSLLFSPQGLYQGGFGYHLAISGKSFAALCEHFPEYLPKVG